MPPGSHLTPWDPVAAADGLSRGCPAAPLPDLPQLELSGHFHLLPPPPHTSALTSFLSAGSSHFGAGPSNLGPELSKLTALTRPRLSSPGHPSSPLPFRKACIACSENAPASPWRLVRLDSPALFHGVRRHLCPPTLPGESPKTSPCCRPGRDGGKHLVLSGQSPGPPFLADAPGPCTVPGTGRPILQPAARPAGPLSWGPSSHPHAPSPTGFILTPPVSPEPAASTCPVRALRAQAPRRELPRDGARPLHLLPAAGPGTPRLPLPRCPGARGLSRRRTLRRPLTEPAPSRQGAPSAFSP